MSGPEETFAMHISAMGILPEPIRESRFHPERKWRMDFLWPDEKIAVEIHGGVHSQGRHTRGTGFTNDRDKMNAATELGYRVFEYTTVQVKSGAAIQQIVRVFLQDTGSE